MKYTNLIIRRTIYNKKFAFCAVLVFLFSFLKITAQKNVEWNKNNFPGKESEYDKAYKAFYEGNKLFYDLGPPGYEGALAQYLDAYNFNPDNNILNFHIGHVYFAIHHPRDAEKYYEKAIKLDTTLREQILYELAVAYHQDGDWDAAISHYDEYRAFLKQGGHKHLNMHEKDVKHELKFIDLCIKQCQNGKIISHDTLAIITENISPAVNSKYPEYAPVVNHTEDLLIFATRRPTNIGNSNNHGSVFEYADIYYSRRTENGWSNAKHLLGDVNSHHAHEAPVWLNGDGTRLLLYYNKSKNSNILKQGDIYESNYVNGEWTDPTPMDMINSAYRETSASMSNDGKTIYFTTNNPEWARHGGMDIVKTTYDDVTGKWSVPIDIGSKINTEWDEESPFIKPDGKHFYFSSQGHTSIGGFDFFKCELQDDGVFSEPINMGFPLNTPFDDAEMYFSDDGKRLYFTSNKDGGAGSFDIYEGYIISEVSIPVEITILDTQTKELVKNATVIIEDSKDESIFKEIIAANGGTYSIYVGVSKSFLILIDAPGYTSQKTSFNTRFEKIINFDTVKIRKAIYLDKNITPLAFSGQLFDRTTNKSIDGIVEVNIDNEKIASLTTVDSKFASEIPRNITYTVTYMAKGYMPYREVLMLNENSKKDIYLDKIKVGDRFAMHNLQFESGKAILKPESVTELEILKAFMSANPNIKLEVSAHTDIVGNHSSNMKLSDSRAKTIYTWLTKNGIVKSRITYKGYGSDFPIADNNTDEGKALNRRAEFKIIDE